ncbi:MAG: hypothetical protein HY794_00565 [Desulfarculus sp.]|nr:hypothetical protein [Desulfarculus sp.]
MTSEMRSAIDNYVAQADLLRILGGNLVRTCATNGGEWHGPCPVCGGEDRLRAYPTPADRRPRAVCRQCRRAGDPLMWAMWCDGRNPKATGETARYLLEKGYLRPCRVAGGRAGRPGPEALATNNLASLGRPAAQLDGGQPGPPGADWPVGQGMLQALLQA